jgi:acylphosphatase
MNNNKYRTFLFWVGKVNGVEFHPIAQPFFSYSSAMGWINNHKDRAELEIKHQVIEFDN